VRRFTYSLPGLALLLAATALCIASEEPPEAGPEVSVEKISFGRVTWGRNSLRLRMKNDGDRANTLAIRIRSYFRDSGSGVIWEAVYPALLPPRYSGDTTLDYFVRPDHGRLHVECTVEDGTGTLIHNESGEFTFEAPYRGEYVLQPYRLAREGVAWEGRLLPPFRVQVSEHFVVYFFPDSDAENDLERIIELREKIFQRLSRDMKIDYSGKAVLFLYPDAELARKITGHRGDGWSYGTTVMEVYGPRRRIDPSHELVHLLASRIGSPPVLFSEGLATSREKEFDNAGRYPADVEAWCRGFLREGALIPLVELMEATSLGDELTRPRVAYPESACFVRHLLDRYGWEKFRQAYAELTGSSEPTVQRENLSRFEKIFGESLRQEESEWKEEVSRTRGRSVPVEMIQRVVKEESVPYLVARARGLLAAGSVEQAELLLRDAAGREPDGLEIQFWLGQTLHVKKDYVGALDAYGRVIRLGDRVHLMQVAWSRVWRGQILDILGRREEALEEYRKAETLEDDTPVQVGGRVTSSVEAAWEGISRPAQPPPP
jgi:tetratricopeptide (TPR) repeat protein